VNSVHGPLTVFIFAFKSRFLTTSNGGQILTGRSISSLDCVVRPENRSTFLIRPQAGWSVSGERSLAQEKAKTWKQRT